MMLLRFGLAMLVVCAASVAFVPQQCGAATKSRDGVWREVPAAIGVATAPGAARTYALNKAKIALILSRAAAEGARSKAVVILPLPDGTYVPLQVHKSPVLSAALGRRNPKIATFIGRGSADKRVTARLDLTPAGFHGQVFTPAGTAYIDPVGPPREGRYLSTWGGTTPGGAFACAADAPPLPQAVLPGAATSSGDRLRTYRLAVTATGEYTSALGGPAAAAAQIATTVNRINGLFEREAAIRFTVVIENLYADAAADPFTDGAAVNDALLDANQIDLDAKALATATPYDIGHIFTAGPAAGLASLASACGPVQARGGSGLPVPSGDAFDIDVVAHQIGHQLGARHTFNGTGGSCGGERVAENAYEPGSGSTLMSLAGSCGTDNVQSTKDDYLHTASFDEIVAFAGGPGSCGTVPPLPTNTPPTVDAGADVTIPAGTPFTLAAVGSDPDGDPLTYCWEQCDLDNPLNAVPGPLFRSRPPVGAASRTFPAFADLLADPTGPWAWESLPAAARVMTFRVTARDSHPGGGGVSHDTVVVNVAGGPFAVIAPAFGEQLECGAPDELLWTKGGSVATMVRPLYSSDGGATFGPLLPETANDSAEPFTVPQVLTDTAWVKLEAVGNVYFSLAGPFSVKDTTKPVVTPPADITAECTSPAGTKVAIGMATAADRCDPTLTIANNAPAGFIFPLGLTPVLWTAEDDSKNVGEATQEVTVVDTTPPAISVAVSPSRIWPPNHKLVTVRATVTVKDVCDATPSVRLVSLTSNEPENGKGDGNTNGDIQGAAIGQDDREFQVRAERSGNGSGRIYTATYEAEDASGNVASAQATISVPHDMR